MASIPSGSVDAIIADLPYGTTACKWDSVIPFEPLWQAYKRIVKANGAIVLTASQPFTSLLVCSNIEWFKYELVWAKPQGTSAGLAKIRPMPSHENVLVFGKGKLTFNPQMREGFKNYKKVDNSKRILANEHKFGYKRIPVRYGGTTRYPLSVVPVKQEKGAYRQMHPTQKPVALLEYLVKTYTNEGETVLDNTMGSGTAGVACVNTNRNFIGIEKDCEYFKIASKRIADAEAQGMLSL